MVPLVRRLSARNGRIGAEVRLHAVALEQPRLERRELTLCVRWRLVALAVRHRVRAEVRRIREIRAIAEDTRVVHRRGRVVVGRVHDAGLRVLLEIPPVVDPALHLARHRRVVGRVEGLVVEATADVGVELPHIRPTERSDTERGLREAHRNLEQSTVGRPRARTRSVSDDRGLSTCARTNRHRRNAAVGALVGVEAAAERAKVVGACRELPTVEVGRVFGVRSRECCELRGRLLAHRAAAHAAEDRHRDRGRDRDNGSNGRRLGQREASTRTAT